MSTDTATIQDHPMMKLLEAESRRELVTDQLVEGTVLAIEGMRVFVDLRPHGTGIIFGREFINARDMIKNLNIGDTVKTKVVDTENEEGYIELSLKEARQALIWNEAEVAIRDKAVFTLPVKEANKGGVIIEWQGIAGFLPASQLNAEHYPRVEDGDKDKIFRELKKLVDEKIDVSIISANPKEGKLIFSEKGNEDETKKALITHYSIGDEVECEVTGVVDFGVFLKIEEGLEGLVHISELDWSLVEDPRKLYKVGDKVRAKVIEIKEGKISLSIKALKQNPWVTAESKYAKDDMVSGVVIKFNKHGALIAIEEGVAGLVHVSEFGSDTKLKETLDLGKSYQFKITLFNAKEQRMTLSYVEAQK